MKRGIPSSIANVALAVGVVLAVAFAIGFTVRPPGPALVAGAHPGALARNTVYLHLPPAPPAPVAVSAAAIPATTPIAVPPPPEPGLRVGDTSEPFDPPPPPMTDTADAPAPPRPYQMAALPPADAVAPAPSPARRATAAPRRPLRLPDDETEDEASEVAPGTAAAPGGPRAGGPHVSGRAIVTAALELNVAGKPLRLAGVKLPIATDMCVMKAGYAARSCADVTRQALAARVGATGTVTCRILAGGRAAWPAVCRDGAGQDLAADLIEHGFALADDTDMVDYSAVETRARTAHSGLWSNR